jgi:hypothetical protein
MAQCVSSLLGLAESALRFGVIEGVSEPQPLIEIILRGRAPGGDFVTQRAQTVPQWRLDIRKGGIRRRCLDFRIRHFRARRRETDHRAHPSGRVRRAVTERDARRRSLRARKPLRLSRERAERGKHAGGGHQHGAGNHPRSKTFAKGTAKQTAGSAAKNPTRSFSCVHGMPPPAKKHTEPKGPANKRKRLTAEARPTSLGGKLAAFPLISNERQDQASVNRPALLLR